MKKFSVIFLLKTTGTKYNVLVYAPSHEIAMQRAFAHMEQDVTAKATGYSRDNLEVVQVREV